MDKKMKFPLRISSVCFFRFTEEILNGKLQFLWSVRYGQVYSEPNKTSKMYIFEKIVSAVNYFREELYLSCVTGLSMHL